MDVLVIGASAAGLKAACRISRMQADAKVKVIEQEKRFGVSTCGLAYYLSGDISDYRSLLSAPSGVLKDEAYYREVKGVEVLTRHRAVSINRGSRFVHCRNLDKQEDLILPYDRLVIATGSQPLKPAFPGVEAPGVTAFTRLEEAIQLRQDLEKGKLERVAVIGAGFIGLEVCDALASTWGVQVDLIELQPQVLSGMLDRETAGLVEAELSRLGVNIWLGCCCAEMLVEDEKYYLFNQAGEMIPADRVIIAAGVKPEVRLAQAAGLEIGPSGGIKVNKRLQTSDLDIYAAGDCVELTSAVDGGAGVWPLGPLAALTGRIAGDNICNGNSRIEPVIGVSIVRVGDLNVGSAGLTAVECREKGLNTGESWGTFHDRMFYYPEAAPLSAKLIFDQNTGEILGLQAVSAGSVLPIINSAAVLMRNRGRLENLFSLEHAYAPPYGQPFNPLHYLAFIAENSRSAGIKLISPSDFSNTRQDMVVLDVRTAQESSAYPLPDNVSPGLITIPVEQLRARLSEVPVNRYIVTVCQMGSRAWDAALILRRAGWSEVGILAGGALFLTPERPRSNSFAAKKPG